MIITMVLPIIIKKNHDNNYVNNYTNYNLKKNVESSEDARMVQCSKVLTQADLHNISTH